MAVLWRDVRRAAARDVYPRAFALAARPDEMTPGTRTRGKPRRERALTSRGNSVRRRPRA